MMLPSLAPEASASAIPPRPHDEISQGNSWCRGPESNRYGCFQPTDFKSVASACSATPAWVTIVEAAPRIELGNKGFADLCLTAWLCRHIKLERETRFELATPALARRCSTAELFPHVHGASGQNRTVDTRIFSPLLYQLSYRGMNGDPDQI